MDLLVFDMDGVLIDVSKSYRKTIQRTIQIYLETCLGFPRSKEEWITNEEISLFKSAGGFNNDWDLTSGILFYLLSISGIPLLPKRRRFASIEEILSYLNRKSTLSHWEPCQRYLKFQRLNAPSLTGRRARARGANACAARGGGNLSSFLYRVKSKGGGLRGIGWILGNSWEGWVYGVGDLGKENLVKRIFQEFYLGKEFARYYRLRPIFYRGEGLYKQERLLISKEILSSLRRKVPLGIASGRPRFEAELALRRFRLRPYFRSVVTLDECREEENRIFRLTRKKTKRSKPHPYPILKAVEEMGLSHPRCGYVGDVVDDMVAARAARKHLEMVAVGFVSGHANRKVMIDSLRKAGADRVIENSKELIRLVS